MGPEELARYRLKRVLGRGGRPGLIGGEVWEAEDLEFPRKVALKILRVDDEDMLVTQGRFVRDAQTVASVRHPNLVAVRDAGEAGGTCFVVMDLVEGKSLATAAEGAPVEDRIRWLREIASALRALHEKGVSHRDVKVENVVVRADRTACLVDLGVPIEDEDGATSDMIDQAAWAALAKTVLGEDAPDDVASVVARAANEDEAARFPTMQDLTAALGGPDDEAAQAVEETAPVTEKKAPEKSLSPWVAVAALAVLIVLAVIVQRLMFD